MKISMNILLPQVISPLYFQIPYHLQYQHDGRANLWGGIGTSAIQFRL
jgi:hypothetical protein